MPIGGIIGYHGTAFCPPPVLPILHSVQWKFCFDNQNKIFVAGRSISGSFNVTSVPQNSPEIKGLQLEFEGWRYSQKNFEEVKKIIARKLYFFGNGSKSMGTLQEKNYKFEFTVPEDCPPSFINGKYGFIKYRLRCVALHFADTTGLDGSKRSHTLFPFEYEDDIIITSKVVPDWPNHKFWIQPMFTHKTVFAFLLSGKIDLWLNTDQKCYQSGDEIHFSLKVKNGGGKNVRSMTLQLVQTVEYNLGTANPDGTEVFLVSSTTDGPSVPLESTKVWNGTLKVPLNLQPSSGENIRSTSPFLFRYGLHLILEMAGSLTPNIKEKFYIQIGSPLIRPLKQHACNLEYLIPEPPPPEESAIPGNSAIVALARRMSMASLSPSLPDYESATGESRFGLLPPSYSCVDHLDLNTR